MLSVSTSSDQLLGGEEKEVKRALTTDLHPILRAPTRSHARHIQIKRYKRVKFIDREQGQPLAQYFEFQSEEVAVAQHSACCTLF